MNELQRLADNFHPQSNPLPRQARTATQGARGSALTWRPPGTWDWLDPIIREYLPQAGAAELRRITGAAQQRLLTNTQGMIRQAVIQAVKEDRPPEQTAQ